MILMIKTKLALSVGGAAAGNALQGNEARPGPVRGTLAHLHICTHSTQNTVHVYDHTTVHHNVTRRDLAQSEHSCTLAHCTVAQFSLNNFYCTISVARCILGYLHIIAQLCIAG